MVKQRIDSLLGFGGVDPRETPRAVTWGSYLEAPMLLITLWVLLDWYLSSKGQLDPAQQLYTDWVIWGFFFFETSLLAILCSRPWRHLRRNWANLVIILCAFPPLYQLQEFGSLRIFRAFFLIGFFAHNAHIALKILAQNQLGKILLVAALLITASGIFIAGIDPAIDNPIDGIWWAWITVTTVGYGDIVPASTTGRIFASILILGGICMVSLITANVSAYLLSGGHKKELKYEHMQLKKLLELEQRTLRIEKKLEALTETLEKSVPKRPQ